MNTKEFSNSDNCVACGEYCGEGTMICVNCKAQIDRNKPLFTRKSVDIDELKDMTGEEKDQIPFIIEKISKLTEEQLKEITEYLINDCDFLKKAIDLVYCNCQGDRRYRGHRGK